MAAHLGTVALVTGSSRGIGAQTARLLANNGTWVFVNYREKAKRADQVVEEIIAAGGRATAVQADLTDDAAVVAMAERIRADAGRLDLLVLNASGGMERGAPPEYALRLNRDAQMHVLDCVLPLMPSPARVVFATSHQAHFHGKHPGIAVYEPVARSKRAGEDALRARIPELARSGVTVVVVSGDMIEGTVTVTLLDRAHPGVVDGRRARAGSIPTVADFANEVMNAASDASLPSGHTIYVGGADYLDNVISR